MLALENRSFDAVYGFLYPGEAAFKPPVGSVPEHRDTRRPNVVRFPHNMSAADLATAKATQPEFFGLGFPLTVGKPKDPSAIPVSVVCFACVCVWVCECECVCVCEFVCVYH